MILYIQISNRMSHGNPVMCKISPIIFYNIRSNLPGIFIPPPSNGVKFAWDKISPNILHKILSNLSGIFLLPYYRVKFAMILNKILSNLSGIYLSSSLLSKKLSLIQDKFETLILRTTIRANKLSIARIGLR